MTDIISWLEAIVRAIPMPLLEVWGRFGYIVGLVLAVCAFGGFTFRIGDRWGFGRARQTWNAKAFLSVPLTAVLVIAAGYIGSFMVLVAGAQTFESLKDLMVLLCIVLLGYPALIAVPPAYMLSDLIEGVPPGFVLDWAEGYFFWAAFVWMAYQLIGRDPDFRRLRTWGRYAVFVALIMLFDPVMWGYICSGKFTSAISYGNIFPALFFTLAVTWLVAPVAFLVALPLARRFGWFWAEIPGHVRERAIGDSEWRWEAGRGTTPEDAVPAQEGLPIRVFIFTPFIALALVDGRRHGDRRAAERGERCGEAGDEAPSGGGGEHPPAAGRLPGGVAVAGGCPACRRPRPTAAEPGRRHEWESLHPRPNGRDDRLVRSRRRPGRAERRCRAGPAHGFAGNLRSDGVPVRSRHGEAALAGNMADLRGTVSRRRRRSPLDPGHGHAGGVLSGGRARGQQPCGDGVRRGAGALAGAGRGAGVDGDGAAPAHCTRDEGHGSRRDERAGAGQQSAGTGRSRAIVQRHGRQAQVVVRRSGRGSRDAEKARA